MGPGLSRAVVSIRSGKIGALDLLLAKEVTAPAGEVLRLSCVEG